MMSNPRPPHQVLSQALENAINGRTVRAALFGTYAFEPDFFETQVVPLLFNRNFGGGDRVKIAILEQELRSGCEIAVFYDPRGVVPTAGPPRLGIQCIEATLKSGVFHPKFVLLLVADQDGSESLVTAILSANLTKAGWFENVEAAHFLELRAGSSTSLRDDLRALLRRLARFDRTRGEIRSLDLIRSFVRHLNPFRFRTQNGTLQPRLYWGSEDVPDFLASVLGADAQGCSLEIISPYFDQTGDVGTVEALQMALNISETRILLPRDTAGNVPLEMEVHSVISRIPGVRWGEFDRDVTAWSTSEKAIKRRFVHAKIYRIFSSTTKREFVFVGSPNLTKAAHARRNFEAGILIEMPHAGSRPDWWLSQRVKGQLNFVSPQWSEEDGAGLAFVPVTFRYDWSRREFSYWWEPQGKLPPEAWLCTSDALPVVRFGPIKVGEWVTLDHEDSVKVERGCLVSGGFVYLRVGETGPIRLLVREEGCEAKPSMFDYLTPEQILEFWSLLSPEQRADFLDRIALSVPIAESTNRQVTPNDSERSMFDRFAGIFHGFSCVGERVRASLDAGNGREARFLFFGSKPDSLPTLLERVHSRREDDVVNRYLTFCCADQLLRGIKRDYPAFIESNAQGLVRLRAAIGHAAELRSELEGQLGADAADFLDWFDQMFGLELCVEATA